MKTIISSVLLLSCSTAFAHDNSCNVDISGEVKIAPNQITFSKENKELYRIVENEQLWVHNQKINLTPAQQKTLTEYSHEIRDVVPEIRSIAFDGIDMAKQGVNMAFRELLGDNSDASEKITQELNNIQAHVNEQLNDDKTIIINEDGVNGDEFLGNEFEQKLESAVEDAVQSSIGSILVAVGQEMIFSAGDSEAFETKMEKFGDKIEQEMDSKSSQLELRADKLCESVVNIDKHEESLKSSIKELSTINILTASHDHNQAI